MLNTQLHPWKVFHDDRYTGRMFSNAICAAQSALDIAREMRKPGSKDQLASISHPEYGVYNQTDCILLAVLLPNEGRNISVGEDPLYLKWIDEQKRRPKLKEMIH